MTSAERLLMLLCCPLGQEVTPFSPSGFQRLSTLLQAAPSLDGELNEKTLAALGYPSELSRRIMALVCREEQLSAYLKAQPEIVPVTRISPGFPQQLRRLGRNCPTVLFCKGDRSLLQRPCISVVGSRDLNSKGSQFARHLGTLAAKEGYTLVSGNARGADQTAQEACLEAGGSVIAFVPDSPADLSARERVLYCSTDGYEFSFTAYRALSRNHPIHAMGEKTFVVQCPQKQGGTWSGAVYNLQHGLSPLFVLRDGTPGTSALIDLGACPIEDSVTSLVDLRRDQLSIFDEVFSLR